MAEDLRSFLGIPWSAKLLRLAPIEQRWLIDQLLPPMGRFILVAQGKTGKSLLALQMAHAIASGTDFLGYPVLSPPQRVHYIDFEMGPVFMQDRLLAMDPIFPTAQERIFVTMFPRSLEEAMAAVPDVGLYVVDPAISLGYENENDAAIIRRKLDVIARVAREEAAAVVLVHHTRKAPREPGSWYQGLLEARGSSAFIDWVDGGMDMMELERGTLFRLGFGTRGSPPQDPIEVVRDPETLTYSRRSAENHFADEVAAVQREGPFTTEELVRRLMQRTKRGRATIYRRLKRGGLLPDSSE